MGYYSEIGIVMPRKDFENLLISIEPQKTDKEKDAYLCLTEADHYFHDKAKSWATKKEIPIVGLHFNWIKSYCIGMNLIIDYVRSHSGAIAMVGEETGDVTMEYYDENEDEIEWYDFLEPIAYVEMKLGKEPITKFKEFINEATICY